MVGRIWILVIVTLLLGVQGRAFGADAGSEWQRIIAAAKKEGKVVIGAPPGNDFRNEVQAVLKKRFDLDSEFDFAVIEAVFPRMSEFDHDH